jgi:hypothetical protein
MNTSQAAAMLGRRGKGIPKNFSKAERKRRAAQLAKVRHLRWERKPS